MVQNAFSKIAAAATVLIVGLYIVSAVFGTMPASEHHKVTNETLTQDVGNWTQVNETYGATYYDNESVYAGGSKLTEGTDYKWSTANESVYFYNTTGTTDGASATITYYFASKPAMARNSIGTIGSAFTLGAVAVIVLIAGLILSLIGGFGGSGNGGGGRL